MVGLGLHIGLIFSIENDIELDANDRLEHTFAYIGHFSYLKKVKQKMVVGQVEMNF